MPGETVEAEAKRFEPTPGKLTVYLVRNRWADAVDILSVQVDGQRSIELLPRSFARLRLMTGDHELRVNWATGSAEILVGGRAGDIIFIELIGSQWPWSTTYRFERSETDSARQRVLAVRMVADAS